MEFKIHKLLTEDKFDELNVPELLKLCNSSITKSLIKYILKHKPEKIQLILDNIILIPQKNLKLIYPQENNIYYPSVPDLVNIQNFFKSIKYTVVIDGCNVLFSKHSSLDGIIQNLLNLGEDILVILHSRHIYYPKYNINIFRTPPNICDDYYTIIAFLVKENVKIISNDKFSDHIEKFKLNNLKICSFKNNLI